MTLGSVVFAQILVMSAASNATVDWRTSMAEKIREGGELIFQAGAKIQSWLRSEDAMARLEQVQQKFAELSALLPLEAAQQQFERLVSLLPLEAAQQQFERLVSRLPLEAAQQTFTELMEKIPCDALHQKFEELREMIPLEARTFAFSAVALCLAVVLMVLITVKERRLAAASRVAAPREKVVDTPTVSVPAAVPVRRTEAVTKRRRTESPAPIANENSEPNRFNASTELQLLAIINSGTSEELQAIKGFGQKTIETVMKYREKHGDLTKLDDLISKAGVSNMVVRKILNSN